MEGKVIKTQDLAALLFAIARNPKGQQLAWNFVKENWTHLLKKLVFVYILIAQFVNDPPAMQRPRFNPWTRKIPWRRDRLPTPVFLGFLVTQLVKHPPAMRETWVWSLGWEDPLEKGKATHASILAWRIPRGCRVRHDWATFTMCILPPRYFSCLKPSLITCSLKHMNDIIFTQMVWWSVSILKLTSPLSRYKGEEWKEGDGKQISVTHLRQWRIAGNK